MKVDSQYAKTRLSKVIRDAARRRHAVIAVSPDLSENTAVSIGSLLRQLKSVTELILPNSLPFLLQANAFAFTTLRAAFPSVVRTATFAADNIQATTSQTTHEEALYAALQTVLSAPILDGYSDEDVATSLSRRAPSPEKRPSRLDT
jgi:hypothetical protein